MQKKEQHLETLLLQAIEQPAYRPIFLQELLDAHVYCVGYTDQSTDDDSINLRQIQPEGQLFIKSWNDETFDRMIPFFTSLEKMQLAIESQESFLCLPTQIFFEMTTGAKLVLNPDSNAVKVFYPNEINALLKGKFLLEPEEYVYDEEVEVLLTEPNPYPQHMVQQLSTFLSLKPEVKAGYLAEMFDANRDAAPVLVIGLLLDTELPFHEAQRLHQQLGQVAFESLGDDQRAIDLVHLDEHDIADGLEHYLLHETVAFYVRADAKQDSIFAKLLC